MRAGSSCRRRGRRWRRARTRCASARAMRAAAGAPSPCRCPGIAAGRSSSSRGPCSESITGTWFARTGTIIDRGMLRRGIVLVMVNVIVFCLLAELLALFFYYDDTGNLFYLHRKTYELIPETQARRLTGDGLHPYFGPTHAPGSPFDIPDALRDPPSAPARLTTNNFGFVAPFDYPFVKAREQQFVIGMLGGSVGAWFCQVGAHRLLDDLKQHVYFGSRELVPVCLSHEGYKQPQQLLVLAYFLSIGQRFDLVINIDGFNEVTLG